MVSGKYPCLVGFFQLRCGLWGFECINPLCFLVLLTTPCMPVLLLLNYIFLLPHKEDGFCKVEITNTETDIGVHASSCPSKNVSVMPLDFTSSKLKWQSVSPMSQASLTCQEKERNQRNNTLTIATKT